LWILELMAIRYRHERVAGKEIGVPVAQQVLAFVAAVSIPPLSLDGGGGGNHRYRYKL
jgi:hypothetical protein